MYIEEKLKKLKFKELTPIQKGVFEAFPKKKHIVGIAKTGTGKTHAYLLPMVEAINKDIKQVQAVIIVPTNELVEQVYQMLMDFEDELDVLKLNALTDSVKVSNKLSKKQPQVVISTPQKVKEYTINQNLLKIQTALNFCLDEADMMFDYDFLSMIDQILPAMPKTRYLLFSATINESMKPFIKKYFGDYILIDKQKENTLKIEHRLINLKHKSRNDVLLNIVEHINPFLAFVFVSKVENQQQVFDLLQEKGLSVCMMHSKLGLKQRKNVIEDIKNLKYQYVVVSDLASRGLDFKVSHVIHYDLPHMLEYFMHRSGRTGRMNDTGIVITIAELTDSRKIEKLKKQGINFVNYDINKNGFTKKERKKTALEEAEINAIKSVKKPKKVSPNYKKKNKALVLKAKKKARNKMYA